VKKKRVIKPASNHGEKPSKKLTIRQQIFAMEYIKCWNASEAARRAKYSEKSAYAIGYDLLRTPQIRAEIDAQIAQKAMSADEVLARLGDQARGSQFPFIRINDDGFIEFDFSDPEAKNNLHLIKTIRSKRKRLIVGQGEVGIPWQHEWIEVELYNAQAALEILAKHHKLLTDRLDVNANLHVDGLEEILEKVYGNRDAKS
jgi:phage terminase small subunit